MKLNFSFDAGNGGNQHRPDYKLTLYINELLDPNYMLKHIYIYIYIRNP